VEVKTKNDDYEVVPSKTPAEQIVMRIESEVSICIPPGFTFKEIMIEIAEELNKRYGGNDE
jgi:hypothetical protein